MGAQQGPGRGLYQVGGWGQPWVSNLCFRPSWNFLGGTTPAEAGSTLYEIYETIWRRFLLLDMVVCFHIVISLCHILQSFVYSLIYRFRNNLLIECYGPRQNKEQKS